MLKVLIADDDPFTLQGIYESLPWQSLGVETVLVASNGSKALEIARRERPQMLLTDVRMPKMNGIDFATAYRETEPNCHIIFMSGFSDKEYLKSAIKLRAVSYVEKPIDLPEMTEAVRLAVSHYRELLKNPNAEKSTIVAAVPLILSEMAIAITKSQSNKERIEEMCQLASISFPAKLRLQTLLIKIRSMSASGNQEQAETMADYIYNLASGLLTAPDTTGLAAVKDKHHIIVHLYAASGHSEELQDQVDRFASNLLDVLPAKEAVFIAVGKPVVGLANAEQSYRTAAIVLQHMFYNGYSLYGYSENNTPSYSLNSQLITSFGEHLAKQETRLAIRLIHSLTFDIKQHKNTTVNSVKEIYFQLLLVVVRAAGEKEIRLFDNADSSNYLWNLMSDFNTLSELREFLVKKIERYASLLKERSPYSSVVDGILDYIHSHYADQELSIARISAHTLLTASYLCNRFKQETGRTINQYLTEYRVGQAKALLRDASLKISDVSARVGYSNGDYFAKCFRKLTGKNPSEYREDLVE
ncbi:response regulator [Paenibacillus lignilyticus]|uniref:Response regulator n=1 Tax=Paenibacillus lignilyticus TaxID=1172615 RepID=A0ABS5C795_9BACL|nr:response regulator [Paenibacillus lignilyticus]MBP3961852.1 response regulator [Paenibacillus lignilyticus]MBP3963477.1 response regulator [Paenibacillus lignilyticus]